jgi:flagella basal body P-ring formation protein FlgA
MLAAALPAPDLARALALVREAAVTLAPAGARIDVQPGVADPRLKLAPCTRAEPFLPTGVPAWGRTRVGLRCAEGAVAWTVYLPVTVQALAPALAPRTALPSGHVLTDGDLIPVETDWAARAERPLATAAALLGRSLARPALAGQPLRQADLHRRRWFASGDPVKVLAVGPGFSVSGEGVALGEGLDGQRVRVQVLLRSADGAESKGPVVNALATGERLVQVAPW